MHQGKSLRLNTGNTLTSLMNLLHTVLPPSNLYIPVVKQQQQEKKLEALRENISNESFYFVFNLLTCELENVNGVDKWLGYSENQFTVDQYLNCIHPGHSVLFNMLAHSMYKILCKGIFQMRFFTQKYISFIPLRHYNGEYILFKKTTSVFQYDAQNRLLAQLNEFNKIGIYDGTPMNSRFTEMEGLQKDEFEQIVFQMTLKNFMEEKYFSNKEFELLKCYASNKDMTSKNLAQILDLEIETIKTYNKRILEKARDTFTYPFTNAKEVALRLKKEKILG